MHKLIARGSCVRWPVKKLYVVWARGNCEGGSGGASVRDEESLSYNAGVISVKAKTRITQQKDVKRIVCLWFYVASLRRRVSNVSQQGK